MNSLSNRLQLSLAISLILLMIILGWVSHKTLYQLTQDVIHSRLEHDAESLLAAIKFDKKQIDSNKKLFVKNKRLSQIYQQPFSGHYFLILFSDGKTIRSRSLWDYNLQKHLSKSVEDKTDLIQGPEKEKLLVYSNNYEKYGYHFTVYVAEDIQPSLSSVDRFINKIILLMVFGLLLLITIQTLVIRRMFKKLLPLQDEIKQLENGKIDKLSENVPTEIKPLVIEFNHLLKQLTLRLERSRNALGNLSHALKGPLNLLVQYFDSNTNQQNNNRQLAHQQTSRIQVLMERELKRARLAGNGFSNVRFNPQSDLSDLIELLEQIYQSKQIHIELNISQDMPLFGDREDMLELIGNLLDNACKWAQTKVSCNFYFDGQLSITIQDDGSGISEHDIKLISQRGTRLDETTEGHGLGLAIAKDIVKLYEGHIIFSKSVMGGLQVKITFQQ
ncbi:MAG: sensor histidine kinase [Gammaproteobacteria bacterium]|nr:sensor histidine kinase [Gammaproteobacteria bacterium]